ncbi:MAG: hypothetical protein JRH16_23185, partial [Deltaproteobacteria bacterium]|nr:hypothetical protein [Deltaproteobacteria bacterium]
MTATQGTGLGAVKKLVRVVLCAWAFVAVLPLSLLSVARAELPESGSSTSAIDETPEATLDFDFDVAVPRFTIGLLGGWVWNRSDSDIYDFLIDQFTIERS